MAYGDGYKRQPDRYEERACSQCGELRMVRKDQAKDKKCKTCAIAHVANYISKTLVPSMTLKKLEVGIVTGKQGVDVKANVRIPSIMSTSSSTLLTSTSGGQSSAKGRKECQ